MTKKHFIAFAREIASSVESLDSRNYAAWLIITIAERDNPHFDRARFLKACGLSSPIEYRSVQAHTPVAD